MLWASFTTAFFGCLRSSEFGSPSSTVFSATSTLLAKDVQLTNSVAKITIKPSKADPFRNGNEINPAASNSSICPLRALRNHLRSCTRPDSPLFTFTDNTFLTRHSLSNILKSLLRPTCPDIDRYSSHSFRIGAATTASAADVPAWLIKVLGRWSSNCFERYIHTPYFTLLIFNISFFYRLS